MTQGPLAEAGIVQTFLHQGGKYVRPVRTVLLALVALLASDQLIMSIQRKELREAVARQVTPAGNALKASLDGRIAVLDGLEGFLSVDWGRPTLRLDFDQFTKHLLHAEPGIRTAQYLVNGVIEQTWPLEGNEAAVGINVLHSPTPGVSDAYQRAVNGHGPILSGPSPFTQGGIGFVARRGVRTGNDSLVAVAAIVIDRDSLMSEAGLNSVPGLRVTVVDENGTWLGGEETLGDDVPDEPISTHVDVADRHWFVEAVPDVGWNRMLAQRSLGTRFGFGAIFLVIGVVTMVYGSRNRAIAEVERARAKQRGELKYIKLFAMTPDGVVLTRFDDATILEVNPGFSDICHRTREELIGGNTIALGLWPSSTERQKYLDRLDEVGYVSDYAVALTLRDGSLRETRISARVFDLDGTKCVLTIVRDVHDQRMLERRLDEAARLESVGRLAGGIAHDFNNLITGITGYSEMLLLSLKDDPQALSDLTEIVRAANRATQLTKQLLAFAKRQMVQPRVVDLNDLILDSNGMLRKLIGDHIVLSTSLSPEPARILIDPTQSDQLLTILTINARDAMPDGGTLKFQVSTRLGWVDLEVTDNGSGIPIEVLPHIFEPFYTTKVMGRGTGLGLATCYGIMMQAGGQIEATSKEGQGATFKLSFPGVEPDLTLHPADLPRPETGKSLLEMSGETILVVEDEIQVRRLCERLLRSFGFNVITSENGVEALAVAEAFPGTIDLLLTDMVMPFMGGYELVQKFGILRPTTRVLRMSGYSDEMLAAKEDNSPFIAKPFTATDLLEAVKAAMYPAQDR